MGIKEALTEKDYLPILKTNNGTPVNKDNWDTRRSEMRELLEKYSYGKTPSVNVSVEARDITKSRYDFAGKCTHEKLTLVYRTEHGEGGFPIQIFTPVCTEKPPVFLNIAFHLAPDWFIPVEDIIDAGYALVAVDYRDMVNDNHYGDFSDGIAAHFGTSGERKSDEWGKIGMWAWGTSRIMDYLVKERSDLDTDKVAVVGDRKSVV